MARTSPASSVPAAIAASAWTSAPEQNAGGAPVITTAPTPGSASISSIAATMSATSGAVSALRRSGSSSVRRAMRSWRSTWSGTPGLVLLAHDGGGVPEERLDVALVAVGRSVATDGRLEPETAREGVDGPGGGELV